MSWSKRLPPGLDIQVVRGCLSAFRQRRKVDPIYDNALGAAVDAYMDAPSECAKRLREPARSSRRRHADALLGFRAPCGLVARHSAVGCQVTANRYQLRRDGNAWMATGPGFIDLHSSPAGFGDTHEEAVTALMAHPGFRLNAIAPPATLKDFTVQD